MYIDITLKITTDMIKNAQGNEKKALLGHLGTHFDVMNKEFPLEYVERDAIVFDVNAVANRDINSSDIDLSKVSQGMFVAFYSGFLDQTEYGTKAYFTEHPQLSNELIDKLLEIGVSIIGVDFAGIRRGKEHTLKDQHCADRGAFVIENLCNLSEIIHHGGTFKAITCPMKLMEMSGLPCRVVAKI